MSGDLLLKLIAKPFTASKTVWNSAAVATASVAETLLKAYGSTLAPDIRRFINIFFKRADAEADAKTAEAKKLTDAVAAANSETHREHVAQLERLEREAKEIENRTLAAEAEGAEAKVGKLHAEEAAAKLQVLKDSVQLLRDVRKERIDEAEEAVLATIGKLVREGGALYVDSRQLKRLTGKAVARGGEKDET